jgi:hypothetical protein
MHRRLLFKGLRVLCAQSVKKPELCACTACLRGILVVFTVASAIPDGLPAAIGEAFLSRTGNLAGSHASFKPEFGMLRACRRQVLAQLMQTS